MSNFLSPGASGLPAPSPEDQQAVPPQLALPPPVPSDMSKHYLSAEDQAALQFNKVKEAHGKISAMRTALNTLLAFGDTVTTDDVVEAAGGLVAAGIAAVEVASALSEMPDNPSQLQTWVQEKSEGLKPAEQQISQALNGASFKLGLAAMNNIIAISAEDHSMKQRLRAMKPSGRPN